ncbi:MAG TPA: glutaminyl-peptide cyclotransferase [Aridibacter sp.]|nr:glutaminyl-peptide cyclotransferase [Aridibacter sp.]
MKIFIMIAAAALLFSCNGASANRPAVVTNPPSGTSAVPSYGYDIIKSYKHDKNAFTQGLFFHNGFLYESTGQYGSSSLRKVEIETGKVLQKYDVPREFFAEGIALLDGKIYQLTWQAGIGFVYDLNGFKLLREFRYSGEGWGLTTDGKMLYHSDGTHVIRVVDPERYQTVKTIVVNDENGRPLMSINELEWVKGEIWANIWHSDKIGKPNHIARIDPSTGKLTGWIDLGSISPDDIARNAENTLNGIAYDPEGDRIFVTGKNWEKMFEIKLKALGQ